jgi:glycine betaine/choline ABC-type transport system substrate-binding protein
MNVTLVHPIHGAKVAINEVEIIEDEKNGWTWYTPDTPAEVAPKADKPVRNKLTRKLTEQTIEQLNEVPSFLTSSSDESEGN